MTFTNVGPYAYRAWASRDTFSVGPWEAWYEIHTTDHQTMLVGPIQLPQEFATGEEAATAAEKQAQLDISNRLGDHQNLPINGS